jgi:hypothetical protein
MRLCVEAEYSDGGGKVMKSMLQMKRDKSAALASISLLLMICSQFPVAAFGDNAPQLQPEAPSADLSLAVQSALSVPSAQYSQPAQPEMARTHTLLNGSVHRSEQLPSPDHSPQSLNPALNGQAADMSGNLQAESASAASQTPYQLALQKLATKTKLSADDYRSLGIGLIGYETSRTYFHTGAKIERLYAGMPAAEAGIKLGDVVIDATVDDSNVKDPTRPVWTFSCGIAGEPFDMTVQRHGQPITFHLVRMNMEDIPDPKVRHMYEDMVKQTGWPVENAEVKPPAATISAGSIIKGLLGI